MFTDEPPDRRHFRRVESENLSRLVGQLGIREEELGRHGFEERLGPSRAGHVHGALGRHDERRVFLPPRLRRFREIGEDGRVAQVAPRFIDHHQFHARGFVGVLQRQPQPFQEVEQGGLTQVLMLGGAGQVDHLPVGQLKVVAVGRVVEVPAPGAVAVPAPHRRPHGQAGRECTKTVIVRRAGGNA